MDAQPKAVATTLGTYLKKTQDIEDEAEEKQEFLVCKRAKRNQHTYISIRSCATTDANKESGWTRVINGFHKVINILAEADPSIVIYPFSKQFKTPANVHNQQCE